MSHSPLEKHINHNNRYIIYVFQKKNRSNSKLFPFEFVIWHRLNRPSFYLNNLSIGDSLHGIIKVWQALSGNIFDNITYI